MSKQSKHTPGPWKAFKDTYAGPWNQSTETKIEAGGLTIASVKYGCDARLIAASPELLDACKQSKALIEKLFVPNLKDPRVHRLMDVLLIAIEKAEGK